MLYLQYLCKTESLIKLVKEACANLSAVAKNIWTYDFITNDGQKGKKIPKLTLTLYASFFVPLIYLLDVSIKINEMAI